MEIKTELPSLFYHNSKDKYATDQGYETLLDFFLSWTLQCAENKYKTTEPLVHEYARRIVHSLIHGHNAEDNSYVLEQNCKDDFIIEKVITTRQWKKIDLLAEIYFKESEIPIILNIENKWYSQLSPHQLSVYRKEVETEYKVHKIVNIFMTCDDSRSNYHNEIKNCKEESYKFLTYYELNKTAELTNETGNALFDEFWFKS